MRWYVDDQEWLLSSMENFLGNVSQFDRKLTKAIGMRRADGCVIVAVNGYNGIDAELHIAATGRWASRDYLRTMFAYLFNELGVSRLTARIEADNRRPLNLARKLGFVDEGIQRCAGRAGRNLILLGMLYGECRWIPEHMRRAA